MRLWVDGSGLVWEFHGPRDPGFPYLVGEPGFLLRVALPFSACDTTSSSKMATPAPAVTSSFQPVAREERS